LIPGGALVPRISIDHWFQTEVGWDGGNFKISVNGSSEFNLVPASAIEFSPYNETLYSLQEGNTNPLAGEVVFSGTDEGQTTGSWGTSLINLYGIAGAGDTIQLRFDFGIDCFKGVTGWYVDDVRVYSCSAELQPSGCGDGVLDSPDEQCDDGNTYIGDGCSNSCQIEPGWQCTTPRPAGEILDPGFEAGTPNLFWDESSTNIFGTPICEKDKCGKEGDSGPAEGLFWSWFGGDALGTEEASLTQTVTIPSTATELRFELEVNACDSAADYFEVLIDGNQVYSINGSNPMCGTTCYVPQSIDIQAYADGGQHNLVLHSQTFANNDDVSNFLVDQLSIPGTVSECSPLNPQLTLIKVVQNDNGGTLGVGDFPLFINGVPTSSGVPVELTAGDYLASETNQQGYAAGDWGGDCDAAGNVSLAAGEEATCTITNDDINLDPQIFSDGFESN
jgi:cysteine-rich repeat protein